MKKKSIALLFLTIFSLSSCNFSINNLLRVFNKEETKVEEPNKESNAEQNQNAHPVPASSSLINAAKEVASKADAIPSINDVVGEETQKNFNFSKSVHREFLKDGNDEEQNVYDYTTSEITTISPNWNFVDEGMSFLFTVDYTIELFKEEIANVLDFVPAFNEWVKLDDSWDVRIIFIPAIKYLRCEEKCESRERYLTFSIQVDENDKVSYTEKQYVGQMYDQYQHAIWFYETHYVEDQYFEVVSSREFDGLQREWLRSLTYMDFSEKVIHFYSRFTHEYETQVFERYGELKYGNSPYIGYLSNDGWFSIFNRQFELALFDYNQVLLYDLEGYESITCDQEIEYFIDENYETRQYNLPLTIKMKDGTIYKNGVNGISLYADAFYNEKQEFVILPYIVTPTFNPTQVVSYLENLGFTLKFDYISIYNQLISDRQRFTTDGSIEKYCELTNARYEHLSMDIIWGKAYTSNLDPIAKESKLVYINSSSSGNVTVSEEKINLSGVTFSIGDCQEYNKENADIDVYLISTEDNYLVGHEQVDYHGQSSNYNLSFALKLDGVLPSPAEYEVRIMLRSNGYESFLLKGVNIDFVDENGYHFYTNNDGDLHVEVTRRS